MWKCPTCGEEIEDQFDACWKCVKPQAAVETPACHEERPAGGSFFRHWRRGWFILFFGFCLSLGLQGAMYLPSGFTKSDSALLGLAALALVVLLLPALAYWMFVLFFGVEAWPWKGEPTEAPAEEKAAALLDEATQLEARGQVKEALVKYEAVAEKYPGTAASRDAQKSRESLRATMG